VHALPLLLSGGARRRLLAAPLAEGRRLCASVGRSCVFLASFVSSIHAVICLDRNVVHGFDRPFSPLAAFTLCGLSVQVRTMLLQLLLLVVLLLLLLLVLLLLLLLLMLLHTAAHAAARADVRTSSCSWRSRGGGGS